MLITGAQNIAGKELLQVLESAGGQRAYALLRISSGEILAIADNRGELTAYMTRVTCILPAEDVRETWYRRKDNRHDKRRSNRKNRTGTGSRTGGKGAVHR